MEHRMKKLLLSLPVTLGLSSPERRGGDVSSSSVKSSSSEEQNKYGVKCMDFLGRFAL